MYKISTTSETEEYQNYQRDQKFKHLNRIILTYYPEIITTISGYITTEHALLLNDWKYEVSGTIGLLMLFGATFSFVLRRTLTINRRMKK